MYCVANFFFKGRSLFCSLRSWPGFRVEWSGVEWSGVELGFLLRRFDLSFRDTQRGLASSYFLFFSFLVHDARTHTLWNLESLL